MQSRLQEKFRKTVVPALKERLGAANELSLPRPVKVVVNVGLKAGLKDPKFVDAAEKTLVRITGQ